MNTDRTDPQCWEEALNGSQSFSCTCGICMGPDLVGRCSSSIGSLSLAQLACTFYGRENRFSISASERAAKWVDGLSRRS